MGACGGGWQDPLMASTRSRPAILDRIRPPVDSPDAAADAAERERGGVARQLAPGWMVWMCLGIVYVVWGSTYLAIRVADETMPPLLTSGVRFLIAGAIVYSVLLVRRGSAALGVTRPQLISCALIGTLLVAGGNGLVMVGEVHGLAGVASGEAADVGLGAFSGRSLAAFAYLIAVGSLVAFTAYVWVLQHAPISKVATYAYVNPVIAIFLGWAILSEHITATIVAGAVIVVASVATIVRRESH